MSRKDVYRDIVTEQFEHLEDDKARLVNGGTDTYGRTSSNIFLDGLVKVIDFFRGK